MKYGLNGKPLDNTAAPIFMEKGFIELIDIPTCEDNKFQYDDSIDLCQDTIDKLALEFSETLIRIRNDHVPHKSVTIHEKDEPWLDSTTKLK